VVFLPINFMRFIMADPRGINPPTPSANTGEHSLTQRSPAPEKGSQKPRDGEESEGTEDMQLAGSKSLNALLTTLPAPLADSLKEQLRKAGASPEKHGDGEWYKRPTDEQLQDKYARVTPQHIRHVEKDTGLMIDQWIVPSQENGKDGLYQSTKRTYRSDGPATTVTDPKTGIVVEEDYRGTHGPNGREYIKRDAETGVVTMERLREQDGGLTFIQRDRTTGVVVSQDKRDKNDKMVEFIAHHADGTASGEKEINSDGQTVSTPRKIAPDQKPSDSEKVKIKDFVGSPAKPHRSSFSP
jgi:hypothetical protein